MAFAHEGFSVFKEERNEYRRNKKGDKLFSKTSNISSSCNVKEKKPAQWDQYPLADGTHRIWKSPLFTNINMNNR